MSGFPILDLIAGMIFIYFLLSIICSSAVELVLTIFKIRAFYLRKWISEIFSDTLAKEIMNHTAVTALSEKDKVPEYIDRRNFVTALLDRITYHEDLSKIPVDIKEYAAFIKDNPELSKDLKRQFLVYANEATHFCSSKPEENELVIFRNKIEMWYDASMERVSGKLKSKYVFPLTFAVSFILVILLNADSIMIAKHLYSNPDIRAKYADWSYTGIPDSLDVYTNRSMPANAIVPSDDADSILKRQAEITAIAKSINDDIPLGWKKYEFEILRQSDFSIILTKICGLLATILAVLMGTPFWFDIMNKVANVRGGGNRPTSEVKKP